MLSERIFEASQIIEDLRNQIKKADKETAKKLGKELRKTEQLLSGLLVMRKALIQANQAREDKK